jgi:hypothetical protein
MAYTDRDDTAEEVEILVAVRIVYILILGVGNDQRILVIVKYRGKQKLALGEQNFFFGHRLSILLQS